MNNTKKVSAEEMKNILLDPQKNNINGNTFVGIDSITIPELKGGQSNPQQGRVEKVMEGASVMVFQNKNVNGYEAMIRRRLIAEGKDPDKFNLKPRRWGKRIKGTPIIEHIKAGETHKRFYIEVIFLKAGNVSFQLDGQPIDKADVIGLTKKKESEQGGLDKSVIVRTYEIASLTRITLNKTTYIIED
jgi:hypothetical protein